MQSPEEMVRNFAEHGPGIWFSSTDFVSRLDHPEYTDFLTTLNLRDLRIVQALLKCAVEHVDGVAAQKEMVIKNAKG